MGVISNENSFVFIHIPKTGGTSVTTVLNQHGMKFIKLRRFRHFILTQHPNWSTRERNIEHAAAQVLKHYLGSKKWDDLHSFSVVRNPWARVVSLYAYIRGLERHFLHKNAHALVFDEFVEYLVATGFVSQWDYLSDADDNLLVDTVLKTETLSSEGSAFISEILDVQIEMPVKNTTNHKPYREIYTARSKAAIEKAFRMDIEQFEYEF